MTFFLGVICLGLLVALVIFFLKNKALDRLSAQSQAEATAAKEELARIRAGTEKSLNEAQALIDSQITDMRVEAARIRGHYEAERPQKPPRRNFFNSGQSLNPCAILHRSSMPKPKFATNSNPR